MKPSRQSVLGIAIAAAVTGAGFVSAAHAEADYPWCLPTENPDCFFIKEVDRTVFPVHPTEVDRVIGKGHEACREMMAAEGIDPVSDWADSHSNSPGTWKKAHLFATLAAVSYCRSVKGY